MLYNTQAIPYFLLAAIAAAHAFVARLAGMTFHTRLDLNGIQRTILLITAMEGAAAHAATDIGIRLFLRHNGFLLQTILPFGILILPLHASSILKTYFLTKKTIDFF